MKKIVECILFCSFISITGIAVGGSVLSFSISGDPMSIFAGPLMVVFALHYLPIVVLANVIAWRIYSPRAWNNKKKIVFILSGDLIGCLIVLGMNGIAWADEESNWGSYMLAGCISGIFCYGAVVALKLKRITEQVEEHFSHRQQAGVEPVGAGQRR